MKKGDGENAPEMASDHQMVLRMLETKQAFRLDSSITNLRITHASWFTPEHLQRLADALGYPHSVRSLALSSLQLGDDQAGTVAAIVRRCPVLEDLWLHENSFGPEGARQIFDAVVAERDKLAMLCMSRNSLGDPGARHVAQLLRHPTFVLKKLYVHCNDFSDDGAVEIAQALVANRSLTLLDIVTDRQTPYGARVLDAFVAALRVNTSLHNLFHLFDDELKPALDLNASFARLNLRQEVSWPVLKVVLVGDSGAGKTSLLRGLRRQPFINTVSTDGVDVATISLQRRDADIDRSAHLLDYVLSAGDTGEGSEGVPVATHDNGGDGRRRKNRLLEDERIVTIWDLAGQATYFSTHPYFFSHRTLYIIVVNISPETQRFDDEDVKMLDDETPLDFLKRRCDHFSNLIDSEALGERQLVVFTHADELQIDEVVLRVDELLCHVQLATGYGIVGFPAEGARAWRDMLSSKFHQCGNIAIGVDAFVSRIVQKFDIVVRSGQKAPVGWILFAQRLLKLTEDGRRVMSWSEMKEIAGGCSIDDEGKLRDALTLISTTAAIFVSEPRYLFLHGQWLADIFRLFVTKPVIFTRRLNGMDRVAATHALKLFRDSRCVRTSTVAHLWRVFEQNAPMHPDDRQHFKALPVIDILLDLRLLIPVDAEGGANRDRVYRIAPRYPGKRPRE